MKSNSFFYYFVIIIFVFGNCNKAEIKTKLISAEAAFHLIKTENNIVIFEVSKIADFKKSHLANAFNIWRMDYENTNHNLSGFRATKNEMEILLSKFGVEENSKILLYDCKGNVDAARVAWQLELFNFNNYFIIDGGKTALKNSNFTMTNKILQLPKTSNFKFKSYKENQKILANIIDLKAAIKSKKTIILDTRSKEEFNALPIVKNGVISNFKKGAFNRGAIATAINYDWGNAVNLNSDHTFKSKATLLMDFKNLGITKEKEIIVYCQSGVRSAHTTFVLRHLLGFENVKNYDGSWIEWSYLNSLDQKNYPIVQNTSEENFVKEIQKLKATINE